LKNCSRRRIIKTRCKNPFYAVDGSRPCENQFYKNNYYTITSLYYSCLHLDDRAIVEISD
jgi:hypothetical protein